MTIYQSLLTRGYFPKELPPAFFTEPFGRYATSTVGRSEIAKYKPADNFTECVRYQLARPGLDRRELRIPHPATFAKLAALTSQNFSRLLKRAGSSKISRSRPIYATGRQRSIQPMVKHGHLSKERAIARAGSSFLLRTDISQFYPSLYTHAVGWAVDPKLRKRSHWANTQLLGKRLDQALMDLDGKVSQGVPIGNDISFLLAEVVLAQVDKAIALRHGRHGFRWFDDYEFAFDTREQAEAALKDLSKELGRFRLRLNPKKTAITRLPCATQDEWQESLKRVGIARAANNPQNMVAYFDSAFRLREQFPEEAVLMYALGLLFQVPCPTPEVARIAQSCITQALLSEPGAAQKAFALLTYWHLNGLNLDAALISSTINKMIIRHQPSGFSSDVSWALSFCLGQGYCLNSGAGKALSGFDDNCIALQSLDMERRGLLPKGFSKKRISAALKDADLDREHWLVAYESVSHNFLSVCASAVKSNPFFADLLSHRVTFYRASLPSYATVIHPGGAPEWVVKQWISLLAGKSSNVDEEKKNSPALSAPLLKLIGDDLAKLSEGTETADDSIVSLMGVTASADAGDEDLY